MFSGMETRTEVVLEVKRLNGCGFFFKQSFKNEAPGGERSQKTLRAQSELKWCLITLFIPRV